ncbi:conserved hypothetical protein [Chlamydia pneumoniae LPCoLN]|uniref:hypothetical protein n=1 Tax=Chlamydia pneumoniae TaxID=83558 RepID=UPI0001BD9C57|nr:hypothetical protein [Chlamydia pneumoniae]ACZ33308.1 conserved hypothetical protein [Chlamydia pneumoniae LPCoLN]ETR80214.1 hypothetical protein X556_0458 [Chlamydia pneumoniae B21]
MAVSGGGGIQPSSDPGKWNPALQGEQAEGPSPLKESIFSETKQASSAAKQESLVRSGSTGMYATESQINKAKYRKAQDRSSTSPKSKLKGTFSKMRASVQGFMSGFGSRASRVSAKRASDSGEGTSLLPTEMDVALKKGNRISPEMQGFFLDASGMGGSSSDISQLSLEALKSSAFSGARSLSLSSSESSSVASFGSFQKAIEPMSEEKVNAWTVARLGGEMVSSLLDPNVETSSLVRRAMATGNEGMIDLSDLGQEEVSTAMTSPRAVEGKVKVSSSDSPEANPTGIPNSNTLERAEKEAEKQESREQLSEDQMMLARAMAGLLTGAAPQEVLSNSVWSGPSTVFPPPKFSGTLPTQRSGDKSKHKSPGIEKSTNHTNFSPLREGTVKSAEVKSLPHPESMYRFPKDSIVSREEPEAVVKESTAFKNPENSSQNFLPIAEESVFPKESGTGGALGSDAVSSSYHFLAQRGVSLLAPLPRATDDYKEKLEAHKGPGGPPDPLIYQYRNVAVEPPIVLRSPQPFSGSSRLSVQGKPEAASVHDDGGGGNSGGFSGDQRRGSSGQKASRQEKKGKKLSRDI